MKSPAIILALLAILALGASLPMEWYAIQKIQFTNDQPFGNFGSRPSTTEDTPVIGSKNYITFLVAIPILFLIIIGIAGAAMALLNRSGAILIPIWGILIPIVFSGAYIILELTRVMKDRLRSPGIGIIVALTGIGLAFISALTCQPKKDKNDT